MGDPISGPNSVSNELRIREASGADRDAVIRVIRTVFDEYSFSWDEGDYHADLYDLDGHYRNCGHTFYVAELDEGVVGTVALERFEQIPGVLGSTVEINGIIRAAASDCSLERMYVLPAARCQGIGFALMSHVVTRAKGDGKQLLEIWSDKRFTGAHRLYGRFGARMIGDRICNDPDVSPEWGLVLELRKS